MKRKTLTSDKFLLLDYTTIGHFVIDQNYHILFWNRTMETWTQMNRKETLGQNILYLFPNLAKNKYLERLESLFKGGPPVVFSSQIHTFTIPVNLPGGKMQIQQTTVNRIPTSDKEMLSPLIFSIQDMTSVTSALQSQKKAWQAVKTENEERIQAEKKLDQERKFLQNVIDSSHDLIHVFDRNQKRILTNRIIEREFPELNRPFLCKECRLPSKICLHEKCKIQKLFHNGERIQKICKYEVDNITTRFFDVHAFALRDENKNIWAIVETGRDITRRVKMEEMLRHSEAQLRKIAHYDPLTMLPNRHLLLERLENALKRAQRNRKKVALFFLDLDRFKQINDILGHDSGDQLLKRIASRLTSSLRETDTVARLGGDEFVAFLEDIKSTSDITIICNKLITAISTDIKLKGHDVNVSASIGISIFPDDAKDVEGLLKCADIAMYTAKKHERNACRFFTDEMNENTADRLLIENELCKAIDKRKEFEIFYQPKISLKSDSISGMEALVRWNHKEKGLISPAKFIPVAEESGLIIPLGEIILEKACKQRKTWLRMGFPSHPVSVNLSPRQFRDQNLLDMLKNVLESTDLPPDLLILEVTEDSLMEDTKMNLKMLEDICRLGVRLAIDDFGTGYSSFSYLKKFPINMLKIDKSFVSGIPENRNDLAIINSIISLGRNLQIEVVAEGIENHIQKQFLKEQGCDLGQGYLFARPLNVTDFEKVFL